MTRRETVRLSCTKQMGSARSSMSTMHPFHCPPETLILRQFGGQSECRLFCFFVNSQGHPYIKSMNKPTSADHEQGACIRYRCALIGEEMCAVHCPIVYGIACFLSTQNNPYFSKISFYKLIPLIQKILRL